MRKVNEKSEPFQVLLKFNKSFKIKYLYIYFCEIYFVSMNLFKRYFSNYYCLEI